MGPDPEMMAPVETVARFMAEGADVAGAFAAQGVVILENFPPFRFEGPGPRTGRPLAKTAATSAPSAMNLATASTGAIISGSGPMPPSCRAILARRR